MECMRAELEPTERKFFHLVAKASTANPFEEGRYQLDAEITGVEADSPTIVDRLVAMVGERLDALPEAVFSGPDALLVEHAALFEIYHLFAEPFRDFIRRQAESPKSLALPFRDEIYKRMAQRRVPRPERFLELFYQLHRAFYFIADGLVGQSPSMGAFRGALWRNVFTEDASLYETHLWNRMEDFSTILLGETGTGKGAAAAAIGRSGFIPFDGQRFTESFATTFVPVNLSELPETLLESELFGHRKGAFTGAIDNYDGVFARSGSHGAIFLDEVGELALPAQVKLLRVLQERSFTALGDHKVQRFEGRVIAATHRSIDNLRREGRFRDDLYYRLCSDVIEVPPLRLRLREAPEELDALVGTLLRRIAGEGGVELSGKVAAAVRKGMPQGYEWPGNVRELEQCVRRVLLKGSCGPDPVHQAPKQGFWQRAEAGQLDAAALIEGYCAQLYRQLGTYEAVSRLTGLDRRTVKKYVLRDSP